MTRPKCEFCPAPATCMIVCESILALDNENRARHTCLKCADWHEAEKSDLDDARTFLADHVEIWA